MSNIAPVLLKLLTCRKFSAIAWENKVVINLHCVTLHLNVYIVAVLHHVCDFSSISDFIRLKVHYIVVVWLDFSTASQYELCDCKFLNSGDKNPCSPSYNWKIFLLIFLLAVNLCRCRDTSYMAWMLLSFKCFFCFLSVNFCQYCLYQLLVVLI